MNETAVILAVVLVAVVGLSACVVCAFVVLGNVCGRLLTERDHLVVRHGSDLAAIKRAEVQKTPRPPDRPPDAWAAEMAAEYIEAMGDGERYPGREPMPEGMNGL